MNNKEIYKKTIGFSIRRLGWDIFSLVIIGGLSVGGFYLASALANKGLIGLVVGIVIGIIVAAILSRYVSYTFKAGQIAMMTKAVSEGKLPNDVIGAGKQIVKERFATVAAYFAVTGVIKGIFNEIGRAITAVGKTIGGDTGGTVGSAISTVIQIVVEYLCDCCLGWVFYRKDEKATKATLEGAVLFFKHGKTLAKNLGRVFGIGLLSLLVIGGVFFGIFYLIALAFPDAFGVLANEISKIAASGDGKIPGFLTDAQNLMLVVSGIGAVIMWSFIHSAFVRPFILVGVLRNYIESGKNEKFSEKDFEELDKKSKKFAKLRKEEA